MRNSEVLDSNIFDERVTQVTSAINQRETEHPSLLKNMHKLDEFIPREALESVYGDNNYDLIQSNLRESEEESINYFSSIINELNNKYNEFNSEINCHLKSVTNKISEAFKLNNPNEDIKNVQRNTLIKKYSNEYLNQLKKIINIHEQIFSHIKDSISIFFNFLNISKTLDKEKPIQDFINKEFKPIIENWLFLKLNLENFNLSKAINDTQLDPDIKNFIFKVCKNKNFVMEINSPKEYMINTEKQFDLLGKEEITVIDNIKEKNKKIMEDNNSNLIKLKMNNIFSVECYFNKNIKYKNLRYLKMNNVSFDREMPTNDNNFLDNIPALEKLVINSSSKFEISLLQNLSKSLIKLSLTKNGFVDYEFNNIMSNYLVNSESIRKNLQILSFSNNNLSYIDLAQLVCKPKQTFYALKELNFERNKIYKFNISPEYFVELKCINCCYNNFAKPSFEQYTNILTLLSGNIYLSNITLAKNYFSSLEKKLKDHTISLTYLNLSYIPKILSNDYISNLIIDDSILINIKKLDFSHNKLKNNSIFKFFENNKGCLALKSLDLSFNLLDDFFFDKFLEQKLNNLFSKLKYINLDANKFGTYNEIDNKNDSNKLTDIINDENNSKEIKRLKLLYKFIKENKNLNQLSMIKNPFKNRYLIQHIEDNLSSFNFKDFVKKDENKEIQISCLYSFLWKIKMEFNGENKQQNINKRRFNLKFDCINFNNINSSEFDFLTKFITFKEA